MTDEQLEELLAAWDAGSECEGLQNLAPSLARRVLAAEKLVEANGDMEEAIRSFLVELRPNCPLVPKEIHEAIQSSRAALAAYREASK